MLVEADATTFDDIVLETAGAARLRLTNTTKTSSATEEPDWTLNSTGEFRISAGASVTPEFELDASGNLAITGSLTTATSTLPDYVFLPD